MEIVHERTLRTFSPDTCNSELVTPIRLTSSFWVASKFFSLKQTYQSVCRSLKLFWRSSDANQGLPVVRVNKDVKLQRWPYVPVNTVYESGVSTTSNLSSPLNVLSGFLLKNAYKPWSSLTWIFWAYERIDALETWVETVLRNIQVGQCLFM